MTISQSLAHFAKNLEFNDLPDYVVWKIKTCLLHGISIGMAGRPLEPGKIAKSALHATACTDGQELLATVLGEDYKMPVMDAVFCTSAMFHARIQEDTYGTAHLGTVCNPVGIALAECREKTGAQLLTALVAGYEVAAAICREYTADSTALGYRATPVYGIFGAATVAGLLLDLTEEELASAYGFAHAFVSGPINPVKYAEWRFEPAMAARNGVMAALLAKAGADGNPNCMEFERGFYKMYCGRKQIDADAVTAHLGKQWEIMKVTFKLFPCCAFNQTHVLNVLALLEEHPQLDAAHIRSVVVQGDAYAMNYPGIQYWGPYSSHGQTCNSTPFCVSVALNYKRCTFNDMVRFHDAATLMLLPKIAVEPKESIAPLCSNIIVEMDDGTRYERAMNVREDFYSFSFDDEARNLQRMAGEIPLKKNQMATLERELRHLETRDSIGALIAALRVR